MGLGIWYCWSMKTEANEVRLGIIGMGNMGRNHASRVLEGQIPGLVLKAVCDREPEQLKAYANLAGYTDPAELIASGEVDAVLIATPHYDHTTLGIQALEAGLHTLVEKPISVHKADAERLIAAHRDPDVVFAAMFNQRTDPSYQKLKELIDQGELGQIHRINWIITNWFRTEAYYASGGWRATWAGEGGGVLLNQCPHQLDLWQWLFGMPAKVRAFCQIGRFHEIEVEDDVTAYLEYENGTTGVFITTTGEAPGTNRLEIACERGKVVLENGRIEWHRNEVPVGDHSKTAKGGFARPGTWEINIPVNGSGEQHLGILKNFAAAIREKKDLLAPAAEGIRSVELANAMLQSSFEDRTVELPLDGAAYEVLLKKKIENSTFVKKTRENTGADDFEQSFS